jgi:pimeloyl-ACP methyl ester carboxylesterase
MTETSRLNTYLEGRMSMQTQHFERPEGTLAYSDYGGSGELVLMLPGIAALRSEYRYLAPKLSEAGYRAVAVDLRGHGESSVPWKSYDVPSVGSDILALIEHLDAGAAHLIGTSFAGAPVVWAAAERPDYAHSLVLIGASVREAKINPIMQALVWLMMNNPWRVRTWAMYYGTLYPTHKPADFKDYMNQLTENMAQPGRFDAAAALATSSRQPSAERLKRVTAPTLVMMGTKDPDFPDPVAEAHYIAEQTSGSVALVEGAGHYPQTEMPEETAWIVIDFLKQST